MSSYNNLLKQKNNIKGAKNNERQKLIDKYSNIVISLAIQYEDEACLELDDLISMGVISLIEAIDNFNEDYNIEISNYIYDNVKKSFDDYITYHSCKNFYNDLQQQKEMRECFDENLTNDNCYSTEDLVLEKMKLEQMREVLNCLTEEEKAILCLKYGINCDKQHSAEEIGQKLNYPKEKVYVKELRAINKVRSPKNEYIKELF